MTIDFTLQQTLDTVVQHLKAGGKQSVVYFKGRTAHCKYRGPNGAACFVGLMIPDDIAEENEGNSAEDVVASMLGVRCTELDGDEAAFASALCDLQAIHDRNRNWASDGLLNDEGWRLLKEWAEDNKLEWPEDAKE